MSVTIISALPESELVREPREVSTPSSEVSFQPATVAPVLDVAESEPEMNEDVVDEPSTQEEIVVEPSDNIEDDTDYASYMEQSPDESDEDVSEEGSEEDMQGKEVGEVDAESSETMDVSIITKVTLDKIDQTAAISDDIDETMNGPLESEKKPELKIPSEKKPTLILNRKAEDIKVAPAPRVSSADKKILEKVAARKRQESYAPKETSVTAPTMRPAFKTSSDIEVKSTNSKEGQVELDLEGGAKGKFEGATPNIRDGEDLDIPPYLRNR